MVVAQSCLLPTHLFAEVRGDVELLRTIAERHRANKEKIVTWQGRVTSVDKSVSPDLEIHQRASIEFVWDRKSKNERWNREYVDFQRVEKGVRRRIDFPFIHGMIKDGAYYQLDGTDATMARTIIVYTTERIKDELHNGLGPVLHPIFWLGDYGGALDESMQYYYDNRKEANWEVSRRGDIVVVEANGTTPWGEKVTNRIEVDLSQGANQVGYFGSDDRVTNKLTIVHTEVAGVWVPKEVTINLNEKKKGGTTERKMTWENKINEKLPDDAFSLTALGGRPGDIVAQGSEDGHSRGGLFWTSMM